MSPTIKIAAIQMDASLAPTRERLQRAERLIRQAVRFGAQLVLLPELFNTGYGYSRENYHRAESITGGTATWICRMAGHYSIHLAGSLLLLDGRDIFNALLLVAPDGQLWRYDKRYPWGWERAFFRRGEGVTVASTDFGDIGLMTCWDTAHLGLWRQYAGRVHLMLISGCPPDVTNPTFIVQDGSRVSLDDFGPIGGLLKDSGRLLFGEMVDQQTEWMGVPTVQTVGCGRLRTDIPNGLLSLISYLPLAPRLAKYLPQGHTIQLECDFIQGCKIVDSRGVVLTELAQSQGETFTLAEITLGDKKTKMGRPQPKSLLPRFSYLSSDYILPMLMVPVYRQALRRLLKVVE